MPKRAPIVPLPKAPPRPAPQQKKRPLEPAAPAAATTKAQRKAPPPAAVDKAQRKAAPPAAVDEEAENRCWDESVVHTFSPHAARAGPFREEPLAVEVLRVAGAQRSSMVVDGALNLKLEREGATY